jgi:hypothetical protein
VSLLFDNPELIRNARIQLRPGRMIAAAVICAVVSVTAWESIVRSDVAVTIDGLIGAGAVLALILNIQVGILLIGGGIFCLQSVHREKDLNTFDYQRVTRMTSLELALGKLFGAPVSAYFLVLCLMPVALIAAVKARISPELLLGAYAILLLGSITYHAFALLISLMMGRGGVGSAVAILFFLFTAGITYAPTAYDGWTIRSLSPFVAAKMLGPEFPGMAIPGRVIAPVWGWRDALFGWNVPHFAFLMLVYVTLTAWFLVAIRGNLKREPALYEIYSPMQAFGLSMYLVLLMLAAFPWTTTFQSGPVRFGEFQFERHPTAPHAAELTLLQVGMFLFIALGLVLLRNRERVRRRFRELGERAWRASVWPAPYLVAAVGLAGGAVVALVNRYRYPASEWDLKLAIYQVMFLAVWLARDALYLQWMSLRRGKRQLLTAILYLGVFYGSTCIIFSALNLYNSARSAAATAILVPTPLFSQGVDFWQEQRGLWIAALLLQAAAALVFAWLQRQRLAEFVNEPASRLPPPAEIAQSA